MGVTLSPDEEFQAWLAAWIGTFDWDENNRHKPLKHGLVPDEVETLFDSFFVYAGRLVPRPQEAWDEPRHLLFLRDDAATRHWTAVVTRRGESMRVITCRRSWPKEEAIYEETYRRR